MKSSFKMPYRVLMLLAFLASLTMLSQPISAQDISPIRSEVISPIATADSDSNADPKNADPKANSKSETQDDDQDDQDESATLRVLTYNIHHGRGTDGKFDYERMAKVISNLKPDVVALQEVDVKTQRASGVDIAKELGGRLKMNHAFGNALYFSGGQYGEAILSRFPIDDAKAHHLPYRFGYEPRTALEVRVTPDNGIPEFIFVGTHLCHQSSDIRTEQTRELNRIFTAQSELPIIMAGDFNARTGSETMQVLLKESWIDAVAPKTRIDYILFRKKDPWEIVETIIVDEPVVSDHDPILTILTWSGE